MSNFRYITSFAIGALSEEEHMESTYKIGYGLLNSIIDKLPFEAHLPGYQYCGPGTKLSKRLARGDSGINGLDAACKAHDIAYNTHKGDAERTEADKLLSKEAWRRVTSSDAGIGERTAALAVAAAMRGKIGISKIGSGLKRHISRKKSSIGKKKKVKRSKKKGANASCGKKKKCSFKKMIAHTKKVLKMSNSRSADQILDTALVAAKNLGQTSNVSKPRIIPLPKIGGVLPLVPIFAGLSALGSLAGGAASIIRAIKSADDGKKMLRGGRVGSVVVGQSKTGEGLYLKPYKKGYGLFLKPYSGSKN